MPSSMPTPACPTWATTVDCPDDCLCCTAYNVTQNANGTSEIDGESSGSRQANKQSPHARCLMCFSGYECDDIDGDGDGECVENATATAGSNMCDWWLWAWNYGPSIGGRTNPNGHDYSDEYATHYTGEVRYDLEEQFYMVGGDNCSVDRVEIISLEHENRILDCNGLFWAGNDTNHASGSSSETHDREGTICYSDYRDPDYRGYCSYEVGPTACVRCNPYSSTDLVISTTIGIELSTGQTAAELNANANFTLGLRTALFYGANLDGYTALTKSPHLYILNLLVEDVRRRARRLLSWTSYDVTYDIVLPNGAVDVSSSDFYSAVVLAYQTAISAGTFASLLVVNLAGSGVTINVTSVTATVESTTAPTFWSETDEVYLPPGIQGRLGGPRSLAPCECDAEE